MYSFINKVIVYLGSKCNLSCSYCHRECEQDKDLNEDFFAKLKIDKFLFKGGEPLLYLDTIKRLKKLHPNAQLSITTNGKDIEKYVDFIDENYVYVDISYDFDNGKARGYIPNLYTTIPYALTSTVYHGNTDILRWCDEAYEISKIRKRITVFAPHIMHCTNDINKKLALTKEDFDFLIEQYRYAMTKENDAKYYPLQLKVARQCLNNYEYGETRCSQRNVIRCDVSGNIFTCSYIRNNKINNFEDMKNIIDNYKECKKCKLYKRCGSMCVQSNQHELECYFAKKFYSLVDEFEITPTYLMKLNRKLNYVNYML